MSALAAFRRCPLFSYQRENFPLFAWQGLLVFLGKERAMRTVRLIMTTWLIIALGVKVGAAEGYAPLWSFKAPAEQWLTWGGGADAPFQLQMTPNGTEITVKDTGKPCEFVILEPKFKTEKAIGVRPSALALTAELLSGAGAALELRLIDSEKEGFGFGFKELHKGRNVLEWKLPGDEPFTWGEKSNKKFDWPIHLWEIAVRIPAGSGDVRLRLRNAVVRENEAETASANVDTVLAQVKVELETGLPVHVLKVGEEDRLAFVFTNPTPEAARATFRLRMEHFDHAVVNMDVPIEIPASDRLEWKFPWKMTRRGLWLTDYQLLNPISGKKAQEGRMSFVLMQPAGPTPGLAKEFALGVVGGESHEENLAMLERNLTLVSLCGMKIYRTSLNWEYIEHAPGVWNEKMVQWFQKCCKAYKEKGIEWQMLLCYCTKWAAPQQLQNSPKMTDWLFAAPPIKPWCAYVEKIVKAFGEDVRYWEVWNESDLDCFWPGTYDQYMELLKATYSTVHRLDTDAQVMTSGFATLLPHGARRDPDFAAKVAKNGQAYFDVFAHHQHGWSKDFKRVIDGPLADIRASINPAKPLFFNETSTYLSEFFGRLQAEEAIKKVTYARAANAIGYIWYNLRSGDFVPVGNDQDWGLVTEKFEPKPVYAAFNTYSLLVGDKEFDRRFPLPPARWCYGFKGADSYVFVAWDETEATAGGPHIVKANGAASAFFMDIMGNASPAAIEKDCILFPVTVAPRFLVVNKAKKAPELAKPLVTVSGRQDAIPGQQLTVETILSNPFDTSLEIITRWCEPYAFGGKTHPEVKTAIPAGSTQPIPLRLQVPTDSGIRHGDEVTLTLKYAVLGTPWKGEIAQRLAMGAYIPRMGPDNREPDFVLENRDHVVNLNENVPGRLHLTWKGADDLSARVWLSRRPGAIALRVDARDDRHSQKNVPNQMWQGDSVQFAISVPGQKGWWEIGLSANAQKRPMAFCWNRPAGMKDPISKIQLSVTSLPGAKGLRYETLLPLAALGLNERSLKDGFRFNLLVNDCDEDGREGWVEIAPGLGMDKDPHKFPVVVFE